MTKRILYLASSSPSRYELLESVGFHVEVLKQTYDEDSCDWNIRAEDLVAQISRSKMEHVILPVEDQHELYVVTADTVCTDLVGTIYGKPKNQEHAVAMIKALRAGSYVFTAFCLDKKSKVNGTWVTDKRREKVITAYCEFELPDACINDYLKNTKSLEASGALIIGGYGSLFLKKIIGSYSGIIGLPLCELRESLAELGFFHE